MNITNVVSVLPILDWRSLFWIQYMHQGHVI